MTFYIDLTVMRIAAGDVEVLRDGLPHFRYSPLLVHVCEDEIIVNVCHLVSSFSLFLFWNEWCVIGM